MQKKADPAPKHDAVAELLAAIEDLRESRPGLPVLFWQRLRLRCYAGL